MGLSKNAAQKRLNEAVAEIRDGVEAMREYVVKLESELAFLEEHKDKVFDLDNMVLDEEVEVEQYKQMRMVKKWSTNFEAMKGSWRSFRRGSKTSTTDVQKKITQAAGHVTYRACEDKKELRMAARRKELGQRFTKSALVCIDEGDPDKDAYDAHAFYERKTHDKVYLDGYAKRDMPKDAEIFEEPARQNSFSRAPRKYYMKKRRSASYKAAYSGGGYNGDRLSLKPDERVVILDNNSSSTYLQVLRSTDAGGASKLWIKRKGLKVVAN